MAQIDLKPGDFLVAKCPDGGKPLVQVGQRLPPEMPLLSVLRVEGASAYLGPLKPGEYTLEVPCSGGTNALLEVRLTPLAQNEMPEPEPPLGFFLFAFPLWFWIALALAIAAIVALAVGIGYWIRRRFFPKPIAATDDAKPVRDPVAEFQKVLAGHRKLKKAAPLPPPEVERFFSEAQEKLRAYLEARLYFKASWATTSEFLGQLKAATLSYQGLKDLHFQCESFLSQADLVRFSKTIPPPEARVKAAETLEAVYQSVEKAMAREGGSPS